MILSLNNSGSLSPASLLITLGVPMYSRSSVSAGGDATVSAAKELPALPLPLELVPSSDSITGSCICDDARWDMIVVGTVDWGSIFFLYLIRESCLCNSRNSLKGYVVIHVGHQNNASLVGFTCTCSASAQRDPLAPQPSIFLSSV